MWSFAILHSDENAAYQADLLNEIGFLKGQLTERCQLFVCHFVCGLNAVNN